MDELIISVFYEVDNFCKELNSYFQHYFLSHDGRNISLEVPSSLSLSEIMTICIAFHLSGFRTFKGYYTNFITKYFMGYFLRSSCNFVVNLMSGLSAYSFFPKKPSLHFGNAVLV